MGQLAGANSAAAFEWQPVSLREAGFADDLEARLDKAIADKRVWNLHSVVVVRNGRLVFERYFEGEDTARGSRPVGVVSFKPDTLHDLRSVSKSIVGLLYGIALAAGKVPAPEAPLMPSFPEYADLAADPERSRWTLHHVLTMSMGTDWNELMPYNNPANSETAMDMAPDRYRYILSRPIVTEPGKRWVYNGGATALLGRLIAKGTGKSLHEYAREVLFDPLGIGPTDWYADKHGELIAASGIRMTPRDLARIGELTLRGGVWERPFGGPSGMDRAQHLASRAHRGRAALWLPVVQSGFHLREADHAALEPAALERLRQWRPASDRVSGARSGRRHHGRQLQHQGQQFAAAARHQRCRDAKPAVNRLRRPDHYPDREHDGAADHDLEHRLQEWCVHVARANPGDRP